MKESLIQRAILDYLAARHIFAVRMNSGAQIGSYKGKKWAIHMNAPGTADILALPEFPAAFMVNKTCIYGTATHPLWIEVKNEKGKQSDFQKSFQSQVESLGHRYAICRSVEDVEAALR